MAITRHSTIAHVLGRFRIHTVPPAIALRATVAVPGAGKILNRLSP